MRLFTPSQPIPDVQSTSQEWKPDPEVTIKHDDLYARAWECEYQTLNFDSDRDELDNHNSPKIPVRQYLEDDETCSIPGTT